MKLHDVVISALVVATLSIGMTSFIATGLNKYNVKNNVDQSSFEKLEKIENATTITRKAQKRASNIESKSNFFNLPGVVKTGKLTYDALKLWNIFLVIIVEITGLNHAPQGWPLLLATGSLGVTVTFIFVKRFF